MKRISVIRGIKNAIEGFVKWRRELRVCDQCNLLREQVRLLLLDKDNLEGSLFQSETERKDLQTQLLDLLNPTKNPKADPQPVGGILTFGMLQRNRRLQRKSRREAEANDIQEVVVEDTDV